MSAERPNLVFIMPDQLRPDFLSCYGGRSVATPNIDALAERGVRFGSAYSLHPVCVPARASLMLGMHALRTGVLDNTHWIRPDYRACGLATWPELLAERGYYTAAIGKMHFCPWDARHGFQYRAIAEDKRWLHVRDDYFHFLHERGHRKYHGKDHAGYFENKGAIVNLLPWDMQVDRWVGEEACRFIEQHEQSGPFAMMVGLPGPHCPYDPCGEFLDDVNVGALPEPVPNAGNTPILLEQTIASNKRPWNGVDHTEYTRDQKMRVRAHYAAEVRQIDRVVGRITNTLRDRGLADHTAIVFASDHGDALGDQDLVGKSTFFESSFHVPMIVATPGTVAAVRDDPVTLTDVTATLLRLAGVDVPSFMDSRPLPGIGIEGAAGRGPEALVGALSGGWMIQDGQWRLAKYSTGEVLLFELSEDPLEQRNRAGDPACLPVFRDLDARLTQAVMAAVASSHFALQIGGVDLSQSQGFGREGWTRPYPYSI